MSLRGVSPTAQIGIVVIGRNEGQRLRSCLESLLNQAFCVYVDSGSTDDSVSMANSLGVQVLQLDDDVPFTAARARNAGFRHLRKLHPEARYVQFVDGDCELVEDWLEAGASFLDSHPEVALVCGRLQERFPNLSKYNLLCDMEWDRPPGEVLACGGIALARVDAFEAVQGFRIGLIAGEEPELCARLRRSGWHIWRIDNQMAWHDAAMTHFGQWWRRTMRNGHAFAESAHLHGRAPERLGVRESRSALFWAIGIPVAGVTLMTWSWAAGLLPFLGYPVQVARLTIRARRGFRENLLQSFFLTLGKFPETIGVLRYWLSHRFRQRSQLIEYK